MAKYCYRCQGEKAPVDSFCSDCGTELETVYEYQCLKCGHASSYGAEFCTQCGSSLFLIITEVCDATPVTR